MVSVLASQYLRAQLKSFKFSQVFSLAIPLSSLLSHPSRSPSLLCLTPSLIPRLLAPRFWERDYIFLLPMIPPPPSLFFFSPSSHRRKSLVGGRVVSMDLRVLSFHPPDPPTTPVDVAGELELPPGEIGEMIISRWHVNTYQV